ncbi:MAG TPA: cupredoxin domain-containing protein [Gammaproteobacteria bacterium]|nr:cupredoxin domain-containing protein [Gammaproteobacteria bacterium]
MLHRIALPALCASLLLLASPAFAADAPFQLTIQNQAFTPGELAIPAGVKIELVVINQDALPAEFESYDLSREVVVPGHSKAKVFIGPLEPGKYQFFNDFHPQSVGWIIVTAAAPAG